MSRRERILVMAHAHPDFSLGGGEIAAYTLFNAYTASSGVEDAWFLARADRGRGAVGHISKRRDNEYLWEQAVHDWHLMKAAHPESVTTWFADLVRALRPTVVHTHHYAHLGLEYLRVIKQVDPSIRIVMTLHEYMAICRNNGQMIKTDGKKLCTRSSLDDCRQCFPQHSAEDFWLRKHFFQSHFALVDQFIAPSEFLRQRYIAWGLKAEKIVVIENGQADELPLPPRKLKQGDDRSRFGFFGQINPFKGLDVVLGALAEMPKAQRKKIVLEVHGANLEFQPQDYQDRIKALLAPLMEHGVVQWVGAYQPHELRSRMSRVDWVVVPSIWWENSPMVIQEAFVCGRPVIASDIGGMREKVSDGIDGCLVNAGNVLAWSEALSECAAAESGWDQLRAGIRKPATHTAIAGDHLALFAGLVRTRRELPPRFIELVVA